MRYLAIDCETTGLIPGRHSIVEFAAVLEDTTSSTPVEDLPTLVWVNHSDNFTWDYNTILFHQKHKNLKRWKNRDREPRSLYRTIFNFIETHDIKGITIAAKNPHFDISFLEEEAPLITTFFSHRMLDPGLLWWKPLTDQNLPDMATCKARAGISGTVSHSALEDARDIVHLVRAATEQKP